MKKSFIVLFVVLMLLSSFAPSTAYARVHHDFLEAYGLEPETSREEFLDYVLENATERPWEDWVEELEREPTKGEVLDNYFYGFETIYPSDLGIEVDEEYADWHINWYMPYPPKHTPELIDTSEVRRKSNKLALQGSMFMVHIATGGLTIPLHILLEVAVYLATPEFLDEADLDPMDEPVATTEPQPAPVAAEPAPKPAEDKMTDVRKLQEEMKSRAPERPPMEVIFGEPGGGTPGGGGIYYEKPVLYLYPEEKQVVTVEVHSPYEMIESIPPYNEGWTVTVEPCGKIDNHYDYLFYELFTDYDFSREAGWVIKRSNFVQKMGGILSEIGLAGQEIDDFVDYWDDSLSTHYDYYAAYYLLPDEIEEVASLTISEKPDSILRVSFLFVPLDQAIELDSPTLEPFSREGFTVVEWGGLQVE